MLLTCPEDAYRYIGETLLDALSKPSVDRASNGRPLRLRLGLIDPDCVLYINTESHEVSAIADGAPESGMVAMNGDTAVRCCQGRIDVEAAVAAGEIAAEGDCLSLLDALAGRASIAASFAEVTRRAGRPDLLGEPIAV